MENLGLIFYVAAWFGSNAYTTTWQPDLVHCNDWQTGLAPAYLRFWPGPKAASTMTIHNLAYQDVFGTDLVHTLKQAAARKLQNAGPEITANCLF